MHVTRACLASFLLHAKLKSESKIAQDEKEKLLSLDGRSLDGRSRLLLVNPTAWTHVGPVLRREVLVLVVNSVIIHELMKLGKVEEGNHRVAVVLHVVVGVPQELTNNGIRLYGASGMKHVGNVDLTVGVFSISNVVDWAVANNDGNNPPEED